MPRTKKTDSAPVTVRPKATRRAADRVRKPAVASNDSTVTSNDIARLAYELYERRGRSHGAELDDWLEAERQLTNSVGA